MIIAATARLLLHSFHVQLLPPLLPRRSSAWQNLVSFRLQWIYHSPCWRLMAPATLLAVHGFSDWPQSHMISLVRCCAGARSVGNIHAVAVHSAHSNECKTFKWCSHRKIVFSAVDRCVHRGLLVDGFLRVMEDALLAASEEGSAMTRARQNLVFRFLGRAVASSH